MALGNMRALGVRPLFVSCETDRPVNIFRLLLIKWRLASYR